MKFLTWMQRFRENKNKDWLILMLLGVLLLIIAIPTQTGEPKQEQSLNEQEKVVEKEELSTDAYRKKLEQELKQILSQMDGIGKVEVMITLKNDGEMILSKDIVSNSDSYQEKINQFSNQQPYVTQQRFPSVEGVVIVAQGAGVGQMDAHMIETAMTLFSIEMHRVKILRMKE